MALLESLANTSGNVPQEDLASTVLNQMPSTSSGVVQIRDEEINIALQCLDIFDSTPNAFNKCEVCKLRMIQTLKCKMCDEIICLKCVKQHLEKHRQHLLQSPPLAVQTNSSPSSSRESMSPPTNNAAAHYCDIHNDIHKLYCEICVKTYCMTCIEIGRCGHTLIHIEEGLLRTRQKNSFLESELNIIIQQIKGFMHDAEMNKVHNDRLASHLIRLMNENVRRMRVRYQTLVCEIFSQKEVKDNTLDMRKRRLDALLRRMLTSKQLIRDSTRSDNMWDPLTALQRARNDIRNYKLRERQWIFSDTTDVVLRSPEDEYLLRRTSPEPIAALMSRVPANLLFFGAGQPAVVRRPRSLDDIILFGGAGADEGKLCRPWGITCNSMGQIVVADRSNNRIQIFDHDGSFMKSFGKHGKANGEFDRPAGVAISHKGNILVADKDNHRIQIFSMNGEFIRAFGKKGSNRGYLSYPWDIACNSEGHIVVCDSRNHRIQFFDEYGTLLRCIGGNDRVPKDFEAPRGICYTPKNQIILTDFNNHNLMRRDLNSENASLHIGREGSEVVQFKLPQGIVCDDEGNVIIADSKNHRIQVLNERGEFLWTIGTHGNGVGQLDTPSGICLTPGGRIAVVDYGNSRIQIF